MLHRIIGPVGSGKREKLLEVARARFQEGKRVYFIVPEQNTADCEGQVARLLGPKSSLTVEVTNFSRLPNLVLREYGSLAGLAPTQAEKRLILAECVHTLDLPALCVGESADEIAALSEELELLRSAGLWTKELHRLSETELAFSDKLAETALLAAAYDDAVKARYRDPSAEPERLAEILTAFPFFRDSTVIIDGFWDFTAPQETLIGRILSQAEDVFISFAARKKEPLLFALPLRSAARILRLARESGVEVEDLTLSRDETGALGHLRRWFSAQSRPFEGDVHGLRLVACKSVTEEAGFVTDEILRLARQGVKWHEIAVLSRDGTGEEILRLVMKQKSIPSFSEEKRSLGTTALAATLLSAVAFSLGMGDADEVRTFLKDGIFSASDEARFALEQYVSTWNLRPRALLRPAPLTMNPAGYYAFTDEHRSELDTVNRAKEQIFSPVAALGYALAGGTVADRIGALVSYLEAVGARKVLLARVASAEKQDDYETVGVLTGEWNALLEALSAFGRALGSTTPTPERFYTLLTLALSGEMPGLLPTGQDRVQIGRVGFARPEGIRFVFLTGLNAGVFPAPEHKGGLFPAREKEILRELGYPVLGEDDSLSREYFYFYLTASIPSEGLILSWRNEESPTDHAALSVLGKRLLTLFPTLPEETYDPASCSPKTKGEAFSRWAEMVARGDGGAEEYADFFFSDETYREKALAVTRASAGKKPFALEKNRPYEGRDVNMVYSRMESYVKCPFSYFARYLLEAKTREKASLGAGIAGTFVHSVLEKVLISLHSQDLAIGSVADELLEKENEAAVAETLAEQLSGEITPSLSYLVGRLKESTLLILKNLKKEFSLSAFRPLFFEKKLDDLDGVYRLPLGDGTGLALYGAIDRVDLYESKSGRPYVRVVDYKTGGHTFNLTDVGNGLSLQMLLYLFALWNQGFVSEGETIKPLPAGVLYLNGLGEAVACNNGQEAKEAASDPFATLTREGLVVDERELLEAADPEGRGAFLPVSWGEKRVRGAASLVTMEKLGRLKQKVERDFIRLAKHLKEGGIEAAPLTNPSANGGLDPCRYCDYLPLCKRRESDRRPYRKKIPEEELFGEEESHGTKLDDGAEKRH